MGMYDRTYAKVDLGAIRHNIGEIRRNIGKDTKIMAIVKADAYGHGAIPVSRAVEDLVDFYGVAVVEEGIELREAGFQQGILILGYTAESDFEDLVRYHISQTVYTYDMAKKLSDTAVRMGKRAAVHIKLDTGMGRLGFQPKEENVNLVKEICELPGIEPEGIFTHFARADEATIEAAREPFRKYMWFVEKLEKCGITIPVKHVSNSAAIMEFPEAHLDCVRAGIVTYGLYPSDEIPKRALRLQPAMEWKAVVSYVKEVEAGTSISYGGTFTAEKPMRVATVPVGYADGMKRFLSNRGRVLIHGEYAPILGRICMDQFMVDVTHIEDVATGDEVTIFGKQGNREIPVEEIAEAGGSFHYEFVCSVSSRVPRKYVKWE